MKREELRSNKISSGGCAVTIHRFLLSFSFNDRMLSNLAHPVERKSQKGSSGKAVRDSFEFFLYDDWDDEPAVSILVGRWSTL